MGSTSKYGRATINPVAPSALGICDRCGKLFNLRNLRQQWDWAGTGMVNRHLRVCDQCYDRPQEQLRAIILPPDPMPARDPRIEPYDVDELNEYTLNRVIGKNYMFEASSDVTANLDLVQGIVAFMSDVGGVSTTLTKGLLIASTIDSVSDVTATLTQTAPTAQVTRSFTDSYEFQAANSDTETSASLGAAASDRIIAVTLSGYAIGAVFPTAMTIGGVSATLGPSINNEVGPPGTDEYMFSQIWWAVVPTGTTGNIVTTFTGGDLSAFAGVYRLIGADTVSPIASSNAGTAESGNVSASVTAGAGSVTLATAACGVNNGSASNTTWTDITEDLDNDIQFGSAFLVMSTASRQDASAPGSITPTAANSANLEPDKTIAVAVFEA